MQKTSAKMATRVTAIALLGMVFASPALAFDIVVNDDALGNENEPGPCDLVPGATTIQAAIDAASSGDDIGVCPGTYEEDLEIIGTDGLTLIAVDRVDKTATVIQGKATSGMRVFPDCGPPDDSIANIDIQANGTTISGFTIQSPATVDDYTCGLIIDGRDNKIYQNHFLVPNGDPGSVAIQTWFGGNNPAVGDISGLVIAANKFASSNGDVSGLGYEAIFINSSAIGADPVSIVANWFGGNLYRAVGVARDRTDVKANDMTTDLPVQETSDFGTIPLGVKLFGFASVKDSKVVANQIRGTSKGNRFAIGLWAQEFTSDNVFAKNVVQVSDIWDCLDESDGDGTLGTDNHWIENDGIKDDPRGICRPFVNRGKK